MSTIQGKYGKGKEELLEEMGRKMSKLKNLFKTMNRLLQNMKRSPKTINRLTEKMFNKLRGPAKPNSPTVDSLYCGIE